MKNIHIIFIFILLFISQHFFSQDINQNFEFSGINKFWSIVNKLERNQEPTIYEWNNLFRTPGYKVLTNGEFTKDFFKKNFRLVFMPSQKKNLETNLKNKTNLHHLQHYIKVRDNKSKIKVQLSKLKREAYNRKAVKRTLEYLPQNRVNQYPPVSFVIFESNGRGSSPIVVDLAASLEWDFMSFLSHEFHHWYRNRQLKFSYRDVRRDDLDIIKTFDLVEAEAIADMVDKKDWFTKPSNSISRYARQFIHDVSRAPGIIQKMDKILLEIYNNPNRKKTLGRKLFSLLPQRGHTTGYFMASLILEHSSKGKLVACVGNPFKFFNLYNKAAKINGMYPTFSEETLKLLVLLRNQYEI
ncbi:MAG: hypothetical protein GY936_06110 [Ignavibacteriae bacterium]|nr:hypothetical protein [Ignavibacteriota bacterium]